MIAYFPQGHEAFISNARSDPAYVALVEKFESLLPYVKHSLSSVVALRIESIQCFTDVVHWIQLECVVLNNESSPLIGQSIQVQYFDLNMPDFIILWEVYESSMENYNSIHIGDDVQVIFSETEIHPATIASISYSADPRWSFSPWQAYSVTWRDANGTVLDHSEEAQGQHFDKCSIWEILKAERKSSEEIPVADRKKLSGFFESLRSLNVAKPFLNFVSLDLFPSYSSFVPYPMSLGLIVGRLNGNFYRRIESLKWDCKLILSNAMLFNEDSSGIVKKASILHERLVSFIDENIKPTRKSSDRMLEDRFTQYRFKEETLTFGSSFMEEKPISKPLRRSDRLVAVVKPSTSPDQKMIAPVASSRNKFVIVPRRSLRVASINSINREDGSWIEGPTNDNSDRLSSSKDLKFPPATSVVNKNISVYHDNDFRRTSSRLAQNISKSRIGLEDFSINSSDVEDKTLDVKKRNSRNFT